MRNERPTTPPPDAITKQRDATDPEVSAWVNANAGSGKTFVLTRRVIRLLLAGAQPESILCLTYTKAAAAEMRHRVAEILGAWTQLDDDALSSELAGMLGHKPDEVMLIRARQLFALALETPGGLKINTIHAFCEAVLQRFPFEAGVPVKFTVIKDTDRTQLILDAREAVLAEGLVASSRLGDAVRLLFSRLSDRQIEKAVDDALGMGRRLEPVLKDPESAKANLYACLAIDINLDLESVLDEIVSGMIVPPSDWPEIFEIAPPEDGKKRFEEKLAALDPADPDPMGLIATYLTDKGKVPSGFPKKAFEKANPVLAANLEAEAERLAGLLDRYRAAQIGQQSSALLDILVAIINRYEAQKRARSWLDFDDLVVRTAALFANSEYGAWIRYKLDAGIDHILVDESQDTNPEQWQVIRALSDDFYSGQGTGRPKTLFAVGDPKQSIYSFQGAEPQLFLDTGREMKRQADQAGKIWRDITLKTSFRTLDAILEGVDAVAKCADVSKGLLAPPEGVAHESARNDKGGTITIWPVLSPPDKAGPEAGWPLEPLENLASAPRQLAQRIARTIKHWIDNQTPLGPRGRAIVPEDVLVLVQTRSPVFGEIVRALKEERIDSPGADRLPVSAHIAVDDLLGLADILLNPADDLMLAAVLRSPLFGLTEGDLFDLASARGAGVSLWRALGAHQAGFAKSAHAQLVNLRQRLDLDRPYEFFADVLYRQEGLKRFHGRLGPEVDEVIAEFLDLAFEHETSDQPSLTGFVAEMRKSDIVIKRDLVAKTTGVRVMTVHGAKGLEAPIVILADAAAGPGAIKDCVFAGPDEAPFLLYRPSSRLDAANSAKLREAEAARQGEEYWRKLYVAMTRAEDVLVMAGCLAKPSKDIDKSLSGTWLGAVQSALAPDSIALPDAINGEDVLVFPRQAAPPKPVERTSEGTPLSSVPFSLSTLPPMPAIETVSPSRLDDGVFDPDHLSPQAERLLDARSARDRGIALHALLQHLTHVPQERRADVALVAATTLLPDLPELAGSVAQDGLEILAHPDFASIFGPDARAEVAFVLNGSRDGKPVRVSGRIDRLVVDPQGITVVDFKSDASAPGTQDDVPEAYWAQLGLYAKVAERLFPGQSVSAAILWTSSRHLMVLDRERLSIASAAIALA